MLNIDIKEELMQFVIDPDTIEFVHNHPPVRYVVKECAFCQLYGNCLSDDDYMSKIMLSKESIR